MALLPLEELGIYSNLHAAIGIGDRRGRKVFGLLSSLLSVYCVQPPT